MGVFIGRKDAEKKRNRSCFRYNKTIFSAEGMGSSANMEGRVLAQILHDFAGSAVVNMVGGLSALVGAKMVGPRIGKYNTDGTTNAIRGHNMPLAALGVFILWFAWFGYNGAAVSVGSNSMLVSISKNFMHINMAAAFSVITVVCITWIRYGKPDTSITLNGGLAGLVAITSGCDVVSTGGSAIIGCIAGIIVVYSVEFFDKIVKIDDPVGTISVHGTYGCRAGSRSQGSHRFHAGLAAAERRQGHGPARGFGQGGLVHASLRWIQTARTPGAA